MLVNKKKKSKKTKPSTLYIVGIPRSLKFYFKAYCAKQGKSMHQVIKEYMREVTNDAREIDQERTNRHYE